MYRKALSVVAVLLWLGFAMTACENNPLTSDESKRESSDKGQTSQESRDNLGKVSNHLSRCKAWAWIADPTRSGVPPLPYQFNSSGGTNTMTRLGVGQYRVDFPGLDVSGGMVQVSAYGGNHRAKVVGWSPSGTAQSVTVRCFSPSGALVDGRFTVLFYKEDRGAVWSDAYLWADNPASPSYTPNTLYQWNSKGGVNTIRRLGVGQYEVTLPGIFPDFNRNGIGGTVLVTAYGSGSERAKVVNWFPQGTVTKINVRCHNASGSLVDARFTLSFMTDVAIGARVSEDQHYGGYVWADQPTAVLYTPALRYQFNNTNLINTITKMSSPLGFYAVRFPSLKPANKTTALVTAYGSGSEYCSVENWNSDLSGGTKVYVKNFNNSGSSVNAMYTVVYLTNEPILF